MTSRPSRSTCHAANKGYVMKIDLNPGRPLLYVKLELGSGEVIGRSFHESERKRG